MPWPEQVDYVERVAREAVGEYVTLFENLDPNTFHDKLADLAGRFDRIGKPVIHAFAEALGHPRPSARVSAAAYLLAIAERYPAIVPTVYSDEAGTTIVQALSVADPEDLFLILMTLCSYGSAPAVAVPHLEGIFTRVTDFRLRVCTASVLAQARPTSADATEPGVTLSDLLAVLSAALGGQDEPMAVVAANALARLGVRGASVVDELAEAMAKGGPDFRLAIVIVLSKVKPPLRRSIEVLSAVSADESEAPLVRARAAKALVDLADDVAEAVPMVLRAAAAGDWPPFEGGVNGLVERGEIPGEVADLVIGLLDNDDPELRGVAAWWLSRCRPAAERAVPALVERLCREPDPEVFHLLRAALGAAGVAAVTPLVDILHRGDMTKVSQAIAALVTVGSVAVPEVSRVLLTDSDQRVRMTGLYVLRELGPDAAAAGQQILGLLRDAAGEERETAVMALVGISPDLPDAVPILIEELCSGSGETPFWAARGLRNLGCRARPAIEQARTSASPAARARLDAVLAEMPPAEAGPPDDLELFGNDDALELFAWVGYLLNRYGPLSAQRLSEILDGSHPTIRDETVKHCQVESVSASQIGVTLRRIEKKLFGKKRLTTRDPVTRRPGVLKPGAKILLQRVQRYLHRRGRWPFAPP